MITIFAIPREFRGLFNIIQLNAIRSWQELGAEIVLFGDHPSIVRAAKKLNVKLVRHIKKNAFGTPLISDAVNQIKKIASHQIVAYVNCDIILLPDLNQAVAQIPLDRYLLIGQRRPLVLDKQIVGKPNWQSQIQALFFKQDSHPLGGSDYFVYPKNIDWPMPPFAVGKLYWDPWFMYYAKAAKIPIINATNVITAIHQQHYHGGFKKHGYGEEYIGQEAQINKNLLGGRINRFRVHDYDYSLTPDGLSKRPWSFFWAIRQFEMWLIINSKKQTWLVPLLWLTQIGRKLVLIFRPVQKF